ncbi:MAG: winged helix-turn-helix transcriptional regulator [Candidatus Hydrogenedentes bacterium]|nr:winged helix-turn-helix transcriptional regulator [Candidatus Hydrogenedentota bacterium]
MDPKLVALVMAQQHFVERLSYSEIAQMHGVSVATVARRLADAKEKGYVQEVRRVLPPPEYVEQLYRNITFKKISGELLRELNRAGAGLKDVVVTAGDANPAVETADEQESERGHPRITRVGLHGARLFQQQLKALLEEKQHVRIGLNWGYAVQMLCSQFQTLIDEGLHKCDAARLEFSALCGWFWIDCDPDIERWRRSWAASAAMNAQILAECFQEHDKMQVHLVRVPALISEEMFHRERELGRLDLTREVLMGICSSDRGYAHLYGEKPIFPTTASAHAFLNERWMQRGADKKRFGSILDHDILLTGLSSLKTTAGFVHLANCELRDRIEDYKTQFRACGDIASHIFTDSETIARLEDPSFPQIGEVNGRVLSLWPEDLKQVANLHRDENAAAPGGVIVLSCGQEKAKALYMALTRHKIANYIVIDTNLAWKLYEELGMTARRERDFSTAELWDFGGADGDDGQENP